VLRLSVSEWQLAEFNIARALDAMDSPVMSGFIAELQRVNELADSAPGFVWRYEGPSVSEPSAVAGDDPLMLLNLSVWSSVETLYDYVYRSEHGKQMVHRRRWFERASAPQIVLWWVLAGTRPSLDEGMARLQTLRLAGPSRDAFTFKARFQPPSAATVPAG
jgi:hypothetical protein